MTTCTKMSPDQRRVAAMISRLDYRLPPGDVTAAVMKRILCAPPEPVSSRNVSWLRDALHWLLTPRPFNVPPAAPLGAVFGVMLLVVVLALGVPERMREDRVAFLGADDPAETPAPGLALEDVEGGRTLVVFTVRAEEARDVALIGSFNNWRDQGFEMRPAESQHGLWTIAVPLEQGRYEYAFLLNGERFMDDPQALLFKDDGFGNRNSVIIVEDHEHIHGYS